MGVAGYDYPYEDTMVECPRCHGEGRIYEIASDEDGNTVREVDQYDYDHCPDFEDWDGTGWYRWDYRECPDCDGEGWVDNPKTIARELEAEARWEEIRMRQLEEELKNA